MGKPPRDEREWRQMATGYQLKGALVTKGRRNSISRRSEPDLEIKYLRCEC